MTDINTLSTYRGRFAPSPSGPLHFGSLVAAVGSYLEAKSRHGEWLLRIEDLDPPREIPGASEEIIKTLELFGFEWDGPILFQSQRYPLYDEALNRLNQKELTYLCGCSRKEIDRTAPLGEHGRIYQGTCRNGVPAGKTGKAIRIKTPDIEYHFMDRLQGKILQNLYRDLGDYILKRSDGLWAYNLAVVVDDGDCGITDIVRGCDLLCFTNQQKFLQQALDLPETSYCHLPLAIHPDGSKLSKQTMARAVTEQPPAFALTQTLDFLSHKPPKELKQESIETIWKWAIEHWDISNLAHGNKQREAPHIFSSERA